MHKLKLIGEYCIPVAAFCAALIIFGIGLAVSRVNKPDEIELDEHEQHWD